MSNKPNIFRPGITNKINNNKKVYYSFIDEKEDNVIKNNNYRVSKNVDPVDKINELLAKEGYIFNKNVLIKTNNKTYDTRIAGKIGERVITLGGDSINIKDILEITEK